jgi:hypothetical protein
MRKTPKNMNMNRVFVMVGGKSIPAVDIRHDAIRYQEDLSYARLKFGSGICRCNSQPLKLVIRELKGILFLACWPDQASLHALDCPFFSTPVSGGESQYLEGALDTSGVYSSLRLHHPVVQAAPSSPANKKGHSDDTSSTRGLGKLHIWGLLHHLWSDSGLNRWNPAWKRNWGLVRYVLRRSAQSTVIDDSPLIHSLYIPPVWNASKKTEISGYWADFMWPLKTLNRSMPGVVSGFVLGIVRKLEPNSRGYVMHLQHHGQAFHIDKSVADVLAAQSRRGWFALQRSTEAIENRVVAMLRIQSTDNGYCVVIEAALMRVSKDLIPISNNYEEAVADALVEGDRRFIRPLHFDAHRHPIAHFVLTDCAQAYSGENLPGKVFMNISCHEETPNVQRQVDESARKVAAENRCLFWQWKVSQGKTIPPLPSALSLD